MNKKEILRLAEKTTNYWIDYHWTWLRDSYWEEATFQIGNMSMYRICGKEKFLNDALTWARRNAWHFYVKSTTAVPDYYNNADNITCIQTYLELMRMNPDWCDDKYILRDLRLIAEDKSDDWWKWTDLIYMGLPAFHQIADYYNDDTFLDKAHRMFMKLKDDYGCYDSEYHLWFRDRSYLPDVMLTSNGRKVFWGRGNGWAIAGLARGLESLKKDKYRNDYEQVLREMAESLIKWQQPDGFWRASIIDPDEFDMPESSGTVLITYGLALGIKLGILDKETYMPYVEKAFNAMKNVCISRSGRFGYVQKVAKEPGIVKRNETQGYAVGAFVLLCEVLISIID